MRNELLEQIKDKKIDRVFIQLPEGLMTRGIKLMEFLQKEGVEAILSLEPCYGACDVREEDAKKLDCDLIVQIGHSDFGIETEIPTLYYPWKIDANVIQPLKENLDKLSKFKNIGLITSINFAHLLKEVEQFLEKKNKKVFTSKGRKVKEDGQILGCDLGSALRIENKVDCFLYIGSGKFHPLGVGLESSKPVFVLNLEDDNLVELDADKFERQRMVAIGKAEECEKFGILVSVKPGQFKGELAQRIKKRLEQYGKKGYIFSFDRITPEKLERIDVDCYVNTACPRITIENRTEFKKPILNPTEFRKVVGKWKKKQ